MDFELFGSSAFPSDIGAKEMDISFLFDRSFVGKMATETVKAKAKVNPTINAVIFIVTPLLPNG